MLHTPHSRSHGFRYKLLTPSLSQGSLVDVCCITGLLKMKVFSSVLVLFLVAGVRSEALPDAEAEADPACNNCGSRPPYIKGARVSRVYCFGALELQKTRKYQHLNSRTFSFMRLRYVTYF